MSLTRRAVLGPVRLAFREDDGMVLVEREKALAAAGRAEHEEHVGAGWPLPVRSQLRLRELAGAAGQRAELARDHPGDVARAHLLVEKARGHGRQLGPGAGERGEVRRLVEVVAERDRRVRAQPQKVSG
jgi:hypothetical protein